MTNTTYRSPVVVVLGHVDHGKTTLLDYIRKSHKASGEVGGITQHIGAYEVTIDKKDYHTNKITFIDTPGHEAFTRLRLQGAHVSDIAILIVDAVDSVMPQTAESIAHIKNAQIPFIVAVNKTDLPGANIEKVKKDLLKSEVVVEGMGGDVPIIPISAKSGAGVADLLDAISLVASLKDLQYNSAAPAQAVIIESKKDKAGPVVTAISKEGTLSVGDVVYAGGNEAKIRALFSDENKSLKQVTPSTPFLLLGFKELPEVGSIITTVKPADVVEKQEITSEKDKPNPFLMPEETKKLRLILKADTQGSKDAILASLAKNDNIEIILSAIGEIAKSDIFLARVSGAIIIGFGVTPDKNTIQFAAEEKVIIKTYNIIYELLDELVEVSDLMSEKEAKAKSLKGEAKVIATFIIEQEQIAGIKVLKGKINLNDSIDLCRDQRVVAQSKVVSLRQRAETTSEIKKNEEAGAMFYPKLDFMVGDVIKSYSI